MKKPRFEFDPEKSRRNRERHGVDLDWAQILWAVPHIMLPARNHRGEDRFFILGKVGGKVYAAICTHRGDAVRIISCHRADRRLEKIYENRDSEKEKGEENLS